MLGTNFSFRGETFVDDCSVVELCAFCSVSWCNCGWKDSLFYRIGDTSLFKVLSIRDLGMTINFGVTGFRAFGESGLGAGSISSGMKKASFKCSVDTVLFLFLHWILKYLFDWSLEITLCGPVYGRANGGFTFLTNLKTCVHVFKSLKKKGLVGGWVFRLCETGMGFIALR